MSHDDSIREDLPEWALGTLRGGRARKVRKHLLSCAECRSELAGFEAALTRWAEASSTVEPPSGLEDRILEALPVSRNPRSVLWAALVGTLVLVLAAGNLAQWWNASRPRDAGEFSVAVLTGQGSNEDAYGTVVLDVKEEKGVLAVRGLSGSDRYRLWIVRDKQWTSVGTFSVAADGSGSLALSVPAGLTGFQAFCISPDEGETYHGDWVLRGSL